MLTVEQYTTFLDYNSRKDKLSDSELKDFIAMTYLLQSPTKSLLDKLKETALTKELIFENTDLKVKGSIEPGNGSNKIDNNLVLNFLGIDKFVQLASFSENTFKENFGEDSTEHEFYKKSVKTTSSDKTIFKIAKLKG